ncbi:hypothetical protein BKA61DRAFT_565526 [Leptodontidium sp. MPI-SDFR-AT-0119]|nr:hypothetical protein BKA61DRAFT_565526 [Leptodontidium sp. MPI-SDFR-AT-0119]
MVRCFRVNSTTADDLSLPLKPQTIERQLQHVLVKRLLGTANVRKSWRSRRHADSNCSIKPGVNPEENVATEPSLRAAGSAEAVSRLPLTELAIEKKYTSLYIWAVIFVLSMGGLLFGCDTGSIVGVIVDIDRALGHQLTTKDKELITSIKFVGAVVGCLIPGFTAHRFGRKLAIRISCVLYFIAVAVRCTSHWLSQFVVGRSIVGVSIGSVSSSVPTYIAELAPARHRSTMLASWTVNVVGGQLGSYGLVTGLSPAPKGRKGTIAIPAVFPVLLFFLLFLVPESPHVQLAWNTKHGRPDTKVQSFYQKSFPEATKVEIEEKITAIRAEFGHQPATQTSAWMKLINTPQARRKLFLACFLTIASQFTGFNSLMFYSTTLLKTIGFDNAETIAVGIAAANFMGTTLFMIIVISCIVLAVSWKHLGVEHKGFPENPDAELGWPAKVIYGSMIVFVFSYSLAI